MYRIYSINTHYYTGIESKYTLRYSGGLVPDVYHILIKGEGVLANASSPSAKAKLRLVFEAAPIALIIEAAGRYYKVSMHCT
jgi:sedoheptulose-bisphosphatase